MVVYYIKKEGESLADYRYPIKEGDICMLYDGEIIKTVYIDSELDPNSIWRDFKFIDTKSLKSYQFPTSNSILCAPIGNKQAIGDTGLLTQLIKECKGEWLLDFLNETSAVLSGFVDYWDLGILSRFIGDDDLDVVYENEDSLTEFLEKPDENKEVDEYDDEEDVDDSGLLPKSDDVKWFCLSALACLEGRIDKRSYQILFDTLNGASRSEIASKFDLTQERIRQIVVKATKQAKEQLIEQHKNIEETKAKNVQLNAQLKLLQEEVVRLKALLPEGTITSLGNENAKQELTTELTLFLETPIEDIYLPARAVNILLNMGVKKFSDIPQIESGIRLLKERNSGRKTVHVISQMLEAFYLTFGMSYTEIINVLTVKDWHTAKKKWIKDSENEEILVNRKDDNSTEEVIKEKESIENSTINIPNHTQGDCNYQSSAVSKLIDSEQERRKYSDNSEWLNKRRFVLETVKMYVRMHPHISYEDLIGVFPASMNYNKSNGVILRYEDVEKKIRLNPRARNYFFLKDDEMIKLSDGDRIVVHSQWGGDFNNFLKVVERLFHVETNSDRYKLLGVSNVKVPLQSDSDYKKDRRIGSVVRLFPSQKVGEIINTKIDKGVKKLEVRTNGGNILTVDDMPYLYEILKKKTHSEAKTCKKNEERTGSILTEGATVELTKDIIKAARTPNGGFTKSQLAAIGVGWPPPENWIKEMVGTMITPSQLTAFNRIEYVAKPTKSSYKLTGAKTYKDVAFNSDDCSKMKAILEAMTHFYAPATPLDIARTISRSAWGGDVIREDSVDSILKRLPEVEYVKWGKYILKNRNRNDE